MNSRAGILSARAFGSQGGALPPRWGQCATLRGRGASRAGPLARAGHWRDQRRDERRLGTGKPREHAGARARRPSPARAGENDTEPELTAMEIERLEADLENAVSAEDYSAAATIRDKLRKLRDDEEAGVIAANLLFYRAFQNSDMRRMRQVWAKGDHIQCIHPGANCIQGYDMVMESWDVVLSGERRLNIDVENLRCYVRGPMAFVTCVEVLRSQGASGRVIATNVFEKAGGQWKLVLHQGAAAPAGALFA